MKYLKLFEEFSNKIYEYYNNKPGGDLNASSKRSKGNINWFTKDEINDIRGAAKSVGIPYIFESSKKGFDNFFGDEAGRGLRDSVEDFFRNGGDLCNEVHLSTRYGNYTIVKKEGSFILNGKNVGKSLSDATSLLR